jgi:cyclin-dependent kinase regulatory subunit CKS1
MARGKEWRDHVWQTRPLSRSRARDKLSIVPTARYLTLAFILPQWLSKRNRRINWRISLISTFVSTRICTKLISLFRIHYSDKYSDDEHEYRHVILPKPLFKLIPKQYFNSDDSGTLRLLSEEEWRGIGITQSLGWVHYEVHGIFRYVLAHRCQISHEDLQLLSRMYYSSAAA